MNYYIDSRNGDDDNTGAAPGRPWRTFRHINGKALQPGDRLLLRRGSHFRRQLRLTALGRSDAAIEITAWGDGPRPVVEHRPPGLAPELNHTGTFDENAPCIYIDEAAHLRVSHLTVYNGRYGLLINNRRPGRSHITVEDVIAVDIHNGGQNIPRVNSFGIGVELGRGCECADLTVSDVTIRNCECFRTGTGFGTKAFGTGCVLENVCVEKVTSHDHAHTPWSYVGLFMRQVRNGIYDGICLDGCAPHWKPTGTATVHHVRSDHIVFRNSCLVNTQDTDSHDMGAWDFESGGDDCLIENCTFRDNAGPAIEYLKRPEETPTNVEVRNCTFVHNDYTLWGGGTVLHIGRNGPDPTGFVHDNNFVLAPGTRFGGEDYFAMENNRAYAEADALPPHVAPPRVDAGPDRTLTDFTTRLAGRVANANSWRWEVILAPGEVSFDKPESLDTTVRFSEPGLYMLRLFAENEHMIYGDYLTVRCVTDPDEEVLLRYASIGRQDTLPVPFGPIDPGERFTIRCAVQTEELQPGKHVLFTNTAGDPVLDGFRACIDNRDPRGPVLLVESGNHEDTDTAYTDFGVFRSGMPHQLAVTFDCTSRDTRGEARIFLDGRDITLWSGLQSDMQRGGMLHVGAAPAASAPSGLLLADPPPAVLAVPDDFRLAFQEDFSGALDNWEIAQGDWHCQGGRALTNAKGEIVCGRKFRGDVLLVYEAGATADDPCDLSATLNAMLDNGPMYGYFFGFGTDGNRCSRLLRRTGPIAEYDARISPGGTHQIACMRAGRTLTHFVDGKAVFTFEDRRPISAGRQPHLSLYTHAGGWFGPVRVYERPPEPLRPLPHAVTSIHVHKRTLTAGELHSLAQQNQEN